MHDMPISYDKVESSPTVPIAEVDLNFPREAKCSPVPSSSEDVSSQSAASDTRNDNFPLDGAQASSVPRPRGLTSEPSPDLAAEIAVMSLQGGSLLSLPFRHSLGGEKQLQFPTPTTVNLISTIVDGSTSQLAPEGGKTVHKETVPVEDSRAAAQVEVSMIGECKNVVLMSQHEMTAATVGVEPKEEIFQRSSRTIPETPNPIMVAARGNSIQRKIPEPVPLSEDHSASLEPGAGSIEIPSMPIPLELSIGQKIALDSLRAFVSAFRGHPPDSFLGAIAPLSSILTFVHESGYPVKHLESQLHDTFALCASYTEISEKSLSEIGEEVCAQLLKEAEYCLASARDQRAQTEVAQSEALTTLQSLRTECATVTKEMEDLQSRLVAMNERKEALESQIGPLEEATSDGVQVLIELSVSVSEAEVNSERVTEELVHLKGDPSFCEAIRLSLLSDIEMQIGISLDKFVSSFS